MEKLSFDDLGTLGREELIARYKNAVGKDPTARALSNDALIGGIRNPSFVIIFIRNAESVSEFMINY